MSPLPARPPLQSPITLQVNGQRYPLQVDAAAPLLAILRNDLGLNGPKFGCGLGECGACTVLVDGVAARACAMPVGGVAGRTVTTLEGLAQGGQLHPVQQAFIEAQAAQCGYCLNGMLMATVALLQRNPRPSDAQARAALSHNLCRCGSHLEILAAVQWAARRLASGGQVAGLHLQGHHVAARSASLPPAAGPAAATPPALPPSSPTAGPA